MGLGVKKPIAKLTGSLFCLGMIILKIMEIEQKYLPSEILKRAILSVEEYGWKRSDIFEVVEKAIEVGLGIIGGQVQFKFPEGTCELYWHKYDTIQRKPVENWKKYCQRTKQEFLDKFKKIPTDLELVEEGINSFPFLKEKSNADIQIENYLIFILYFNAPSDDKTFKLRNV